MDKSFTPIFTNDDGGYDFTFADDDDLQYISTNPDGFLADDYQAAAQAELAARIAATTPPAPSEPEAKENDDAF